MFVSAVHLKSEFKKMLKYSCMRPNEFNAAAML